MQELSKTGRKIRKDSFEYNNDMEKVRSILKTLYLDRNLSTNDIPPIMEKEYNIRMSSLKCYYLIKSLGIIRNKSESISLARSELDYNKTIMNLELKNIIDGIVIGDGTISPNHNTKVARVSISGQHEEFISYCQKLLLPYGASSPVFRKGKKGNGTWSTTTKHHPDLYVVYNRWYQNQIKIIPNDIQLDKMTLLLWYLGDGSISMVKNSNSRSLYFSTNCFNRKDIEDILVPKLHDLGVKTSRITNDCRLFIETSSIVKLLNLMGNESPVSCYSYKFIIEEWRFKKTMKDTAIELNIDYQKLANWVKTGFVKHSRSTGGKKVVFSDNEFNELKKRLENGELPREKGKKARVRSTQNTDIVNSKLIQNSNETEDDFLNRVINAYYEFGFPNKIWNEEKLLKEWHNLWKSQYIIPNNDTIIWRKDGLSFADYFHPHIFDLNYQYKMSPKELFNNRDEFKKALRLHMSSGGVFTFAGVYNAICRGFAAKRVNNFSPLTARDIYNYYCQNEFKVIDPCAGFSGRLIGASFCKHNINYLGIDPSTKTFNGLIETKKFINIVKPEFKCNLINDCAEDYICNLAENSFDFCFTSPPYFNLENYSLEPTQSCIRYPEYNSWLELFIKKVLKETYRVLKNDRIAAINIGRANKHDIPSDLINIAKEIGFTNIETKYISFDQYSFVDGQEKRLEPLIILKK